MEMKKTEEDMENTKKWSVQYTSWQEKRESWGSDWPAIPSQSVDLVQQGLGFFFHNHSK